MHIKKLNIDEFAEQYVTNERRRILFEKLLEELQLIRSQCRRFRVIVFGSFITNKEKPNDIDLMISIIPDQDHIFDFMTDGMQQKNDDEVDIQYQKAEYFLKNAQQLVDFFNENPLNKKNGIQIQNCVEIKDV